MKRLSLKDQVIVLVLKNIQDYINLGLTGEKDGQLASREQRQAWLFQAHDNAENLIKEIEEGKLDNFDVR